MLNGSTEFSTLSLMTMLPFLLDIPFVVLHPHLQLFAFAVLVFWSGCHKCLEI